MSAVVGQDIYFIAKLIDVLWIESSTIFKGTLPSNVGLHHSPAPKFETWEFWG